MPKRLNPYSVTEKEGVIYVQKIVNSMRCIWRPTPNDDYGLDGEIEIASHGEVTGRLIKVQVKSGTSYFTNRKGNSFDVLIEPSDLDYWLQSNLPVILIVYDPKRELAFWKSVKQYVATHPEATTAAHRITFSSRSDKFQRESFGPLCRLAFPDEVELTEFLKDKVTERIYSNLLPVISLPPSVYTLSLSNSRLADIDAEDSFGGSNHFAPIPGGHVTFCDPSKAGVPYANAIISSSIKLHSTTDLLANKDMRNAIVRLFNNALFAMLGEIGFLVKDRRLFYFTPAPNNMPRTIKWEPMRRSSAERKVAYPYVGKRTGQVAFWVHHAARISFRHVARKWFLMLTPAYVFTRDGVSYLLSKDAGALATSRMSHERNYQVLNHLFFWAWFLKGGREFILIPCGSSQITVCSDYATGTASFGIGTDRRTLESILSSESYDVEWQELEDDRAEAGDDT